MERNEKDGFEIIARAAELMSWGCTPSVSVLNELIISNFLQQSEAGGRKKKKRDRNEPGPTFILYKKLTIVSLSLF